MPDREGHDWPDNDLRFARLSLAAAEIAAGRAGMNWQPDLLHVNDWPGGLAPAYLRWQGARVPTVLTIHNIAYQGLCDRERMHALGIPERAFDINGVEFHDRVSFLKAGLFYADHVSTVSPTYAREITTEASRRRPAWPDTAGSPLKAGCPASSTASTKAGTQAATRICRTISRRTTSPASRRTPSWCAPGCA